MTEGQRLLTDMRAFRRKLKRETTVLKAFTMVMVIMIVILLVK